MLRPHLRTRVRARDAGACHASATRGFVSSGIVDTSSATNPCPVVCATPHTVAVRSTRASNGWSPCGTGCGASSVSRAAVRSICSGIARNSRSLVHAATSVPSACTYFVIFPASSTLSATALPTSARQLCSFVRSTLVSAASNVPSRSLVNASAAESITVHGSSLQVVTMRSATPGASCAPRIRCSRDDLDRRSRQAA